MTHQQTLMTLAEAGLRMPIAADLILHERPDADAVRLDGERLGEVIAATARRFRTPLAIPLMDLRLEKAQLLTWLGVPATSIDTFHLSSAPTPDDIAVLRERMGGKRTAALQAQLDAIHHVARYADLIPAGMVIGPFSLMTKLLGDPITAVYLAGMGMSADTLPEVALLDTALELATLTIMSTIDAQLEAGAAIVVVCEPAANSTYISPLQMESGSDVFTRYVLHSVQKIKDSLDEAGAALFLHDCGELTDEMIRGLGALRPAVLSLGSSRPLWEVAPLAPDDVILFGNLPSRKFFSDSEITCEEVVRQATELAGRMRAANHPLILGTECDVLHVPGCAETINRKINALMQCPLPSSRTQASETPPAA